MSDTLAALTAALHADAETLRVLSQNVANAQTPAYRREIPIARTTFDAATTLASSEALAAGAADGFLDLGSAVDVHAGTLQSTAEPLNLAIEGPGFFVVSGANGEVLTRRGDFHLDAQGQLVTSNGATVLGTNGPIQIGAERPVISTDGTVRSADVVVDRLRIVEVTNGSALQAAGDGTYTLAEGEQAVEGAASQVRQGFIETSNVQSVNEMISLIETMRRFEAAQRFVRGYDDMTDKAISTLGKI
jgi:flagellar basal-body rod protein FlgF